MRWYNLLLRLCQCTHMTGCGVLAYHPPGAALLTRQWLAAPMHLADGEYVGICKRVHDVVP